MKGSDTALQHLQRAILMELSMSNTYTRQASQLADWGVDKLAGRVGGRADDSRDHARRFIDRMVFLDGKPDVHALDGQEPDGSVRGVLQTQMHLEKAARDYYVTARSEISEAGDPATAHLFRQMIESKEAHIDELEAQFSLMEMMGEQLYIARQTS